VTDLCDVVTSPARRAAYLDAGSWDSSTLPGVVAAHATTRPDARAVVDEHGAQLTYGTLWERAARVARFLADEGIGDGAVVSVQLPNRLDTAVVALGVLAAGAVINPLLPNYRARELAHVFETARPRAVFTPATYRGFDHEDLVAVTVAATGVRPVHVVCDPAPGTGIALADVLARDGAGAVPPERDAAAVSELIFTSGTEATPKAIMHTEQTTNFSVRVAAEDLQVTGADVVWMPSPLGHSTGFNYGLRFALYHGIPLVLQDRWDAVVAFDVVARERCSYTLAATTFLRELVAESVRRDAPLDALRCFGCGGAPVPPALVEEADARGIHVLRLYGSTEVLVATWNRPDATRRARVNTDGTPMTGVDVEVRGGEDGPGAPGEIFVRGPNTSVGFFADPDRTAATFDDGWVRSGDLATLDGDRNLTIVGRKKEVIIRGGMNITPRELEDLIATFAEVAAAAVVGTPDERLGELVCACVVLQPGATLELVTVVDRLRDAGIATYKLPQCLELFGELPTTASGKIQKHEILRRLEERR
jgi:acyl-CoA synthetase (AMP-forming)/AMP-acid ligase II